MRWLFNIPRNIKKFFKQLPNKKHHLDFLIAMLSIPVLTLAVVTNVTNLQKNSKSNSPTPPATTQTTVEKPIIIERTVESDNGNTEESKDCKKEVGPVSISYPSENEVVEDNPVCINIKYNNEEYCSVVWSYRINNSSWSDYNSNSVCLYDMPKGKVKFDLRVQSTVSQDQISLTRNFDYQGTASSSAN